MNFYKNIVLIISLMSAFSLGAQEKQAFKFIHKKVNDNFYLITSNNSATVTHLGLVIGEDGLLLVDAYHESKVKELYQAIQQISDKPLKYVINTHSHPDHSGGNKFFAEQGAIIISQDNARFSDAYGQLRFKDAINVDLGNEVMQAKHVVSHTYDDAIVYLENSNVVFMGDNLSTHTFLSIGEQGLAGHLLAFDTAIAMSNEDTIVIPAHAAFNEAGVTTLRKKDLYNYKKKFTDWVARLEQLHNQNMTTENMASDTDLKELTLAIAVDGDRESGRKMLSAAAYQQIISMAEKALFSKTHNLSDSVLQKYIGNYRSADNAHSEIYIEENKLFIREKGKFIAELLPISEQEFLLKGYFFGIGEGKESIKFEFNESGQVEAIVPYLNSESVWKTEMDLTKKVRI